MALLHLQIQGLCKKSPIYSCWFAANWCHLLWVGQIQLLQHREMIFEKNITDKCNKKVHRCWYDLSNHTISIHMTFIEDAGAPLWSKGHCHVIPQRWGWWEWGNNLWTVGAYSWPGDDWSTILCGGKGVFAQPPFLFWYFFLKLNQELSLFKRSVLIETAFPRTGYLSII